MKKILCTVLALLLVISSLPINAFAVANDDLEVVVEEAHVVRFVTNLAECMDIIPEQRVAHGEKAERPENPSSNIFQFIAWSLKPDGAISEYNFATPVIEDITLYARWNYAPWYLNMMYRTNWGKKENNTDKTDVSLNDFAVNESNLMAGEDNHVVFTVRSSAHGVSVFLENNENKQISKMYDDGTNGDEVPNDGVYSLALAVNHDGAGSEAYFASSGNTRSDSVTLFYFERPTETTVNETKAIQEKLLSIESLFLDADGFVPSDKVDELLTVINEYIQSLQDSGSVLFFETTEHSVMIKLSAGLSIYYAPNIDKVDSIGSNVTMTVVTYQPCLSMYSDLDQYMALPDDAALKIGDAYSNYRYASNYDNAEVSLSRIKAFSSNKIILWHGHGGYAKSYHSVLLTGEDFDWNAWWWDVGYWWDCVQDRIINSSSGRAMISSKFIDKYCGNMNNSFFYLAACESGKDDVLAKAFLNKGASAVVANTEIIYTVYNLLMEYEVANNLTQINEDTMNYYTLNEALNAAKEKYGNDDLEWFSGTNPKSKAATPMIFGGTVAKNYRLANAEFGTLSGKICRAADKNTPVPGALITVYSNGTVCKKINASNSGNYSIDLPEGEYRVDISANGYITFKAYATISKNEITYTETFLLIEGSDNEFGTATGTITDAMSGEGLQEVSLEIRSGWNNLCIGEAITTIKTDSDGKYSLKLPLGNYTMYATKDGYIATPINIIVQEGITANQNGSMSPIVSGDSFRIVLSWGENPRDLDSHVIGKLTSGEEFHVYYSHMNQYDGDIHVCSLDVDDTRSYGPETITLNALVDSPYYYYVHRYAGSGTLAYSAAKVKVYQGESLLATFNVPVDQDSGDYWNVFAISNGTLVIKNTITSQVDTNYVRG